MQSKRKFCAESRTVFLFVFLKMFKFIRQCTFFVFCVHIDVYDTFFFLSNYILYIEFCERSKGVKRFWDFDTENKSYWKFGRYFWTYVKESLDAWPSYDSWCNSCFSLRRVFFCAYLVLWISLWLFLFQQYFANLFSTCDEITKAVWEIKNRMSN